MKRPKRSRRRAPTRHSLRSKWAAALYAVRLRDEGQEVALSQRTSPTRDGDGWRGLFEKGKADGSRDALTILEATVAALHKA